MTTLAENMRGYTLRPVERAKRARALYHNMGAPTIENFNLIVKGNMIKDCPVTIEDINIAADIWGKDIDYLKWKSTWSRPTPVRVDWLKFQCNLRWNIKKLLYVLILCI